MTVNKVVSNFVNSIMNSKLPEPLYFGSRLSSLYNRSASKGSSDLRDYFSHNGRGMHQVGPAFNCKSGLFQPASLD